MVEGKKIEEEVCIHKFDGCTFGGCFGPSGCRHVLIAENKSLMERVKTLEKTELSEITSLKAAVENLKDEKAELLEALEAQTAAMLNLNISDAEYEAEDIDSVLDNARAIIAKASGEK